ncbi:serine/threonine protein kinase [Minicystis rosea]|nr:serine/threonine protein kinase [Minicystis rosea]
MSSLVPDETLLAIAATVQHIDPGATLTARPRAEDAFLSQQGAAAITIPPLPSLSVAEPSAPGNADLVVNGVLGEGGMGRVLSVHQRSLRRDVAVKVLKTEAARHDVIDALLAEAVITGSLEHPNVVPVHALGLDADGRPVLVMKRIEGVSWRDIAEDAEHPAWSAVADAGDRLDAHLEILMAACNALHFAHSRGIVHRDVKLDNVMIGSFGEVYMVDWGIAVRTPAKSPGGGLAPLVGTPAYMAPEMVRGDIANIDARTDVYLLGATLHAAITGAVRHRGATIFDILLSARDSRPFVYGPEVPAELASILNRAMSAEPKDRFPSALELRRALAAFRRHRGSIALSNEAATRLAALPALGSSGDERRVHALLTECRFGFTQALRSWPENEAARAGLSATLVAMIEHELAQRDAEGARALHAELGEPRPDLLARIEALAAELGAAAEREARLRTLERDRDISIGGRAQLAVLGTLPLLAITVVIYLLRHGGAPADARVLLVSPAIALALLVTSRVLFRARLRTEISRRALSLVMLFPAAGLAHRALGSALGATHAMIFTGDLVIAAAISATLGLTIAPRLGWGALPFLLGAIAVALAPTLALAVFSATLLSGLIVMMLLWRRTVVT